MAQTRFVSVQEALELHRALIERFGGRTELTWLNARLRCWRCGSRDTLLFRGYDAGGFKWGHS